MKQYLLLLKSGNFVKSGNVWTSEPINLYANEQYYNYSNTRSRYGVDLIGDRTFVGTEVASPRFGGESSTPLTPRAVYVTDYGEVVSDPATPQLFRFVDTSSRIDILSYRHVFTNVPGSAYPSFNLTMFESDSSTGPWLKTPLSGESNTIFHRDCKPFIKLELDIFDGGIDLNTLGLIFYLEVGIYDPISPVISRRTRNILERFPSWTELYADSVEPATPETALPKSVGGKFLNALVQENLDTVQRNVDLYSVNSFITTADINQLAWIYVTENVNVTINYLAGDGVKLGRVGSISDLLSSRPTDYVFFYNPASRQVLTLRKFQHLTINESKVVQEAVNVFNDFDEFGARVSLPRLYLESNENYKKRILDVSVNPPDSSMEGFKRTLRRELDLWRAYGATPDSNYLGATPIVYEISDLEFTTPYFTDNGVPAQPFRTLVNDINERFPSNFGYVNWGETVWDYGGLELEGLGRLPAQYDVDDSGLVSQAQNGVGDLEDLRISLDPVDTATANFSGYLKISGTTDAAPVNAYSSILIQYSWYFKYRKTVPDYQASLARAALVYEVDLRPHGNHSTPSTFYANLDYNSDSLFKVGNNYFSTHPASPEYNFIRVFDQEGDSIVTFRNKYDNAPYYNSVSATPATTKLNINNATAVRVVFKRTWNQAAQAYQSIATDSFRFAFNKPSLNWIPAPAEGALATVATPNIDPINANILIGSNIYASKLAPFESEKYADSLVLNASNDMTSVSGATINTASLMQNVLLPFDAVLDNIIIDVIRPQNLSLNGSSVASSLVGGRAFDPQSDTDHLVPSSPNIKFRPYNRSNSPTANAAIFESATISFSATPSYLKIESATGQYYPFPQRRFSTFTAQTTPSLFSGFIDQDNNTYKSTDTVNNVFFNQDKFLDNVSVRRASFGLNPNTVYSVTGIEYVSSNPKVKVSSNDDSVVLAQLNSSFNENLEVSVPIYAERLQASEGSYSVGINSGWGYIGQEEYYLYYDPVVQQTTGRFFSLPLQRTPKMAAPIIVEVGSTPYRNIVFEDSATPGKHSFVNVETIIGGNSSNVYLAYKDVRNISIKDTYTGKVLFNNLSTSTNVISPFNAATPLVSGREYEISYQVNQAFHVEKDIFNELTNSYASTLYLSSTPSLSSVYKVVYESAENPAPKAIDLELNQVSNPLTEGFVYASVTDYPFSKVDAHLSPRYITDDRNDFMSLSLVALDSNGNLKPNQTFTISGSNVAATPSTLTVNDNGYGTAVIRYTGPIPATTTSSSLIITGLGSATPGANANSSAQGYQKAIPFSIAKRFRDLPLEIRAVPYRYNLDSDSESKNIILGQVYWNGEPLSGLMEVSWGKARTLYDVFNKTNSYVAGGDIRTGSDGRFTIENAITAGSSLTPGYWLAAIHLKTPTQASALAQAQYPNSFVGAAYDFTRGAGDIVYWYEEYDNVNFINEYTPLPSAFIHQVQSNADIIATPNFVYTYHNPDSLLQLNSTPAWRPPSWVHLRGYDRYQGRM